MKKLYYMQNYILTMRAEYALQPLAVINAEYNELGT